MLTASMAEPAGASEGTLRPPESDTDQGWASSAVWTDYGMVRGWERPTAADVPDRGDRLFELDVYGKGLNSILVLIVILVIIAWPLDLFSVVGYILLLLIAVVVLIVVYLSVTGTRRRMAEVLHSLSKETDLTPEEAVTRTQSILVSERIPFTRMSVDDPKRYWNDVYTETFTVAPGGSVRIRVFDERPSGRGDATKVFVGPAAKESEQLVSTLLWRLDKVLPECKPQQ